MQRNTHILVLDQGSTSSRAVLYNRAGKMIFIARQPLAARVPAADRVEHDPSALWESQSRALTLARKWLGAGGGRQIAALAVANQRSTFLLWDRRSGKPLTPALSWQDRRGEEARAERQSHQSEIRARTGLRLTAHSTIAKLAWVLRHVPGARRRAEAGDLLFGTVNTYVIWRLTRGRVHATDHVNASRTLMMNLASRQWDEKLLALFEIPRDLLPEIRPTSSAYGEATIGRHAVPILASIGDQQASLCGQGGFASGHLALTYGTGGFLLWNVGRHPPRHTALLSTVAWSSPARIDYAQEGTVNAAGSVILWLQKVGLISSPSEIDPLCRASRQEIGFVPALSGLGSPYYRPVETALFGVKRTTTRADLVRGAIEGIAFLLKDNFDQMRSERRDRPRAITAGGGAAASRSLLQCQADVFQQEIGRSSVLETTSRGAAYLAGLASGIWKSPESLSSASRPSHRFRPRISERQLREKAERWRKALELASQWSGQPA